MRGSWRDCSFDFDIILDEFFWIVMIEINLFSNDN